MKLEEKKQFVTMLESAGEQTRALVMIEYTHEGRCSLIVNGQIADITFCVKNLDLYVNKILSGTMETKPNV